MDDGSGSESGRGSRSKVKVKAEGEVEWLSHSVKVPLAPLSALSVKYCFRPSSVLSKINAILFSTWGIASASFDRAVICQLVTLVSTLNHDLSSLQSFGE